jgi:hypothetical protein
MTINSINNIILKQPQKKETTSLPAGQDSFEKHITGALAEKISNIAESGQAIESGYIAQPNNLALVESMDQMLQDISEMRLAVDKALASLDRIFQESKG